MTKQGDSPWNGSGLDIGPEAMAAAADDAVRDRKERLVEEIKERTGVDVEPEELQTVRAIAMVECGCVLPLVATPKEGEDGEARAAYSVEVHQCFVDEITRAFGGCTAQYAAVGYWRPAKDGEPTGPAQKEMVVTYRVGIPSGPMAEIAFGSLVIMAGVLLRQNFVYANMPENVAVNLPMPEDPEGKYAAAAKEALDEWREDRRLARMAAATPTGTPN